MNDLPTHACMPAASRAASAVSCLRKAAGRMQQGRSQSGTSRRRSCDGPRGAGSGPKGTGPLHLFCCAAGWCLAGCGPAACGAAAFLRQGTADAALLAAGMQACVGRELVVHQAA